MMPGSECPPPRTLTLKPAPAAACKIHFTSPSEAGYKTGLVGAMTELSHVPKISLDVSGQALVGAVVVGEAVVGEAVVGGIVGCVGDRVGVWVVGVEVVGGVGASVGEGVTTRHSNKLV